jgi:isopentenyl diphosphate isomerase/L-lactate dehydrogenase-like FMN-dependent dehydrogenase
MTLSELYEKGAKILAEADYGFLLRGVETEFVLANNRRIIDRYTFRQRCIDAVQPETGCEVLGVALKTPIVMSAITMPIPAIRKEGLRQLAEGLKAAGSLMWTGSPIPSNLRELVETGVPVAATVKPFQDRRQMYQDLERLQEAGVRWVGLEIDVGQGTKIGDRRIVSGCAPLSTAELKEVRKRISAPLIFKGVLSREDAVRSVEIGADGIVLSNHGAHTIDYLPHPFQVMDEIVEAVRGKIAIIVDGGFRRGSDVLKGLAFGADLVGLGRPILWALAADGRDGVRSLIEEMTEELGRIMGMVGAPAPNQVRRETLIEQ